MLSATVISSYQTQAQHAVRQSLLPKAALAQKGESKNTNAAESAWPLLQALTRLSALMDLGYAPAAGKGLFYGFPMGKGRCKHLGMLPLQRTLYSELMA